MTFSRTVSFVNGRVMAEGGNIIVSRVALLEDDTVFQRYVNYLRTGVYV